MLKTYTLVPYENGHIFLLSKFSYCSLGENTSSSVLFFTFFFFFFWVCFLFLGFLNSNPITKHPYNLTYYLRSISSNTDLPINRTAQSANIHQKNPCPFLLNLSLSYCYMLIHFLLCRENFVHIFVSD